MESSATSDAASNVNVNETGNVETKNHLSQVSTMNDVLQQLMLNRAQLINSNSNSMMSNENVGESMKIVHQEQPIMTTKEMHIVEAKSVGSEMVATNNPIQFMLNNNNNQQQQQQPQLSQVSASAPLSSQNSQSNFGNFFTSTYSSSSSSNTNGQSLTTTTSTQPQQPFFQISLPQMNTNNHSNQTTLYTHVPSVKAADNLNINYNGFQPQQQQQQSSTTHPIQQRDGFIMEDEAIVAFKQNKYSTFIDMTSKNDSKSKLVQQMSGSNIQGSAANRSTTIDPSPSGITRIQINHFNTNSSVTEKIKEVSEKLKMNGYDESYLAPPQKSKANDSISINRSNSQQQSQQTQQLPQPQFQVTNSFQTTSLSNNPSQYVTNTYSNQAVHGPIMTTTNNLANTQNLRTLKVNLPTTTSYIPQLQQQPQQQLPLYQYQQPEPYQQYQQYQQQPVQINQNRYQPSYYNTNDEPVQYGMESKPIVASSSEQPLVRFLTYENSETDNGVERSSASKRVKERFMSKVNTSTSPMRATRSNQEMIVLTHEHSDRDEKQESEPSKHHVVDMKRREKISSSSSSSSSMSSSSSKSGKVHQPIYVKASSLASKETSQTKSQKVPPGKKVLEKSKLIVVNLTPQTHENLSEKLSKRHGKSSTLKDINEDENYERENDDEAEDEYDSEGVDKRRHRKGSDMTKPGTPPLARDKKNDNITPVSMRSSRSSDSSASDNEENHRAAENNRILNGKSSNYYNNLRNKISGSCESIQLEEIGNGFKRTMFTQRRQSQDVEEVIAEEAVVTTSYRPSYMNQANRDDDDDKASLRNLHFYRPGADTAGAGESIVDNLQLIENFDYDQQQPNKLYPTIGTGFRRLNTINEQDEMQMQGLRMSTRGGDNVSASKEVFYDGDKRWMAPTNMAYVCTEPNEDINNNEINASNRQSVMLDEIKGNPVQQQQQTKPLSNEVVDLPKDDKEKEKEKKRSNLKVKIRLPNENFVKLKPKKERTLQKCCLILFLLIICVLVIGILLYFFVRDMVN